MSNHKKILDLVKKQVKFIFENELLLEADYKKKILEKYPIDEKVADYIAERLGKLSLWFLNAVTVSGFNSQKEFLIKYINGRPEWFRLNYDQIITKILDWIRHPSVAGTVDLKTLTLDTAIMRSNEFHEQLKEMGGEIDYEEKNQKLVQYDNDYYWAIIPSSFSQEECDRMGHCGRTQKGDMLYSLRSNKPYGKNHTINDSHVTVAYNSDEGIMYQSKSKKNQKPAEKYHAYIFDLIMRLPNFHGFGREYSSSNDYGIEDMNNEQIVKLYKKSPSSFSGYMGQKILADAGLIEAPKIPSVLRIKIDLDDIIRYLKIGSNTRDDIVEKILGDPWGLYDGWDSSNWEYVVDDIDDRNLNTIMEWVSENYPEIGKEIKENNESLENLIREYPDEMDSLKMALNRASADSLSDEFQNYCYKELKSSLEELGNVVELHDGGAVIDIDFKNIIDQMDLERLDEFMEACDNDYHCVLNEIIGNGEIELPRFYLDDRYSPYVEDETFNQYLIDALDEYLT